MQIMTTTVQLSLCTYSGYYDYQCDLNPRNEDPCFGPIPYVESAIRADNEEVVFCLI